MRGRFYIVASDDQHSGPLTPYTEGCIIDRTTNCPAELAGDLLADGMPVHDLQILVHMLNRFDFLQQESGLRKHPYGYTKEAAGGAA